MQDKATRLEADTERLKSMEQTLNTTLFDQPMELTEKDRPIGVGFKKVIHTCGSGEIVSTIGIAWLV